MTQRWRRWWCHWRQLAGEDPFKSARESVAAGVDLDRGVTGATTTGGGGGGANGPCALSPSHGGGPRPSSAWQAAWPDADAVSSQCIGDDGKTPDALFLAVYREMTYRHLFAVTKPSVEDRIAVWTIYTDLFDRLIAADDVEVGGRTRNAEHTHTHLALGHPLVLILVAPPHPLRSRPSKQHKRAVSRKHAEEPRATRAAAAPPPPFALRVMRSTFATLETS